MKSSIPFEELTMKEVYALTKEHSKQYRQWFIKKYHMQSIMPREIDPT
jgi:hypothetical protein